MNARAFCWSLLLFAAAPQGLLAHPNDPIGPGDVWRSWSADPFVVGSIVLLAGGYALGVTRLWRRAGHGRGVHVWQAAAFGSGILALAVAQLSPIDRLGGVLFTAHMLQHVILMLVAAPLLVLGAPVLPILWALPMRARRRVGQWGRLRVVKGTVTLLTLPVVAWVLHATAMWGWHVPAAYQATLTNDAVHALQHLSFTASALLFWWVVAQAGRRHAIGYGAAALMVFTITIQSGVLGALLTVSPTLLYPVYSRTAVLWGLTPLEDQQLGGLIMWVPASVIYLGATLVLVAAWLRRAEHRAWRSAGAMANGRRRTMVARAIPVLALILGACGGEQPVDGLNQPIAERAGRDNVLLTTVLDSGDARRAPALMRHHGCHLCHVIPGVRSARGQVGPSLAGMADRVYIAGRLPNQRANMVVWLLSPQVIAPGSAMPSTGLTPQEAQDIAAYMYTLRGERQRIY